MNEVLVIGELEGLKNTINQDALQLGKNNLVFKELHTTPVNFTCHEAGFLRMISWLYMLYYESGRGEIDFVIEKFGLYNIDKNNILLNHYRDIRILRTTFQHNFDPAVSRNASFKVTTDAWFLRAINSIAPSNTEHWEKSLNNIIDEAKFFLTNLHKVIKFIETDEFKETLIEDWNKRSSRSFQAHDFDSIIQVVIQEFGMLHFDALKFRKQNLEMWTQDIKGLTGNFNFNIEARKLIERDILTKPVLPITGSDIIELFDIQPGLRVKEIMEIARKIYLSKPCDREELIKKLAENI